MGARHPIIMPFPNPQEAGEPEAFVDALIAEYGPEISEAKFLQMASEGVAFAKTAWDTPIQEIKDQLVEMGGQVSVDEGKITEVSDDAIGKVQDIIVPFVATEVFKWLDRDSNKGISKDEIMFFISAAMKGEEEMMAICQGFLWQTLDKDGNGSLSTAEISGFVAEILQIVSKVGHCVIDTFATAFKGDAIQVIVSQAFQNLDADNDGFIDEGELQMVKEGLEALNEFLTNIPSCDEDEEPLLKLILADVADAKAFAATEAKDGADLAKVCAFNRQMMDARVKFFQDLLNNEDDRWNQIGLPPAMVSKIKSFGQPVVDAINKVMEQKLEGVTKCFFDIADANKDGKLDEEEFLAIAGIMDAERSAEDKFNSFLAMIDTDGDKQVSPDELTEFASKVFDLGICTAQAGIDIYSEIAKVVAKLAIEFVLGKVCGGDELSKEKFDELLGTVMEDGPEALLGPLMEEE